ncbi:hypothetical protein RM780_00290 [Streptomyces sp. DSM 44917]|uniref:WD40 repeat domain-containing protein n=1 Tax=Streptomyces boetiae TaxID=3075541 RepID=A0ABU2L1G6_9ACTN|nr:hypothetical protein [Streptomyces sp. DSM 44917]MDT0305405.1 hypothetical protein [Streptomyces sp. DSM 44917]
MPSRSFLSAAVGAAAALCLAAPAAAVSQEQEEGGAPEEFTISDPRITEASGLVASGLHPGVYWTHNDQDVAPNLYAVDSATGETVATVTLAGVTGRDMEAISRGPDGALYVGDIGDNDGVEWPEVWIYRLPEPEELADATVTPEVFTVRYADGPRDAEALMVHPGTGRVWIADKQDDGTGALYAGPEELSASGVNVFEPVADIDLWVTDGAFSPDGSRLMLRGYFTTQMYRWRGDGEDPEPLAQRIVPRGPTQGEAVAFSPDGRTLLFGGEGAGSEVEPAPLTGQTRPDSVAAEDEAAEETPPGREDGREGRDRAEAGSGDGGGDGEGGVSVTVTTAVILAAVVVLGARSLRRRRSS